MSETFGEKLDGLARKYQADNPGVEYRTAMLKVLETRPDLGREYRTEHKRKPAIEIRDPLAYERNDTPGDKRAKDVKKAERDLEMQARTLVLLHGVTYDKALRHVLQDPANAEKVQRYIQKR